jgi:tetratricopeptide (TPR) repeat protein
MEKRDIEIKRNIIEKSMMNVKDYLKKNRKPAIYALAGIIAAVVIIIVFVIYTDNREKAELTRFEEIMEIHNKVVSIKDSDKSAAVKKTIEDLKSLIDSTYWGYVHKYGNYFVANLYYSEKDYKESVKYHMLFADKNPSSPYAALSLMKSAVSYEIMNNNDEAIKLYQRLEKDYSDSAVSDQILYDIGRLYQIKNDTFKAREYFNKVIAAHPQSVFSQKAKKRLFFLAYGPGVKK